MAQTLKDTNKDVTGDKCVCDDKQNLTITDEAKLHAWKEHYQRLFNVEFPWDKNSLNNSAAVEEAAIFVVENMVTDAIKKMKQRKAGGPSRVIVKMIKAGGKVTVTVKILENVLESLIHSQVDINNMQFGFVPGNSTTDAIYILQQMEEKQFIRKKIYFAFVDLPLTRYLALTFGGL